MASPSIPSRCDACGFAQASHHSLWIDSVMDAITLRSPVSRIPFYRHLMRVAEAITDFLGLIAFYIFRALGVLTLSDDPTDAVSTRSKLLMAEGKRRGLSLSQVFIFGKPTDSFTFIYNARRHFFRSLPLMPPASALRMDDKILFKEHMRRNGIPVPMSVGVRSLAQARKALEQVSIACVKPRTGSNGRHTYPNVRTEAELAEAFASVKQITPFVTVEEYLEGNLSRATCVGGTMVGFLESAYPTIVGDGTSTLSELIQAANAQKLKDIDDMVLDEVNRGFVARRGYSADSILSSGEALALTYRGGTGSGGSNREHGRSIHPSFIPIIEDAARATGLHIVGFDIIIPDPMQSQDTQKWGFIEANSLPWIDLHATPYYGEPIDVSKAVWDLWLMRNPARGTR